jgi:hypothetical protein
MRNRLGIQTADGVEVFVVNHLEKKMVNCANSSFDPEPGDLRTPTSPSSYCSGIRMPFFGSLFGQGRRLFDHLGADHIELEPIGSSTAPAPPISAIASAGERDPHAADVGGRSRHDSRCNQGGRRGYSNGRATTTMKKATTPMKKRKSGSQEGKGGDSPSQLIDARIKELSDWRGETLARVRSLVKQADPDVVEEWKWRGVPVWSHAGMICTGETYKNVVKMTFAKGASLEDPSGLFNSSLEGNTRRAIDLHEGDEIDEKALKALIRAAVALNTSPAGQRPGTSA